MDMYIVWYKKTMEIIASGHRWGEWEVIKESTAIEEGWQQRTCKICWYA